MCSLKIARRATSPLLLLLFCSACDDLRSSIDTHERRLLEQFRMSEPPEDPSNAYATNPAAAALGRRLFFDTEMSGPLGPANSELGVGAPGMPGESGKVGCFSCHDLKQGGADRRSQPAASSLGASWTTRNAPTVLNAAYSPLWFFWDGRADSLWGQAVAALEGGSTHNSTRLQVAHTVYTKHKDEYEAIFGPLPAELADTSTASRFPPSGKPGSAAFDGMATDDKAAINRILANVGKSIAAYERQLVCKDSPFDKWLDGDQTAMSPAAVRGLKVFIGRGACLECHLGPLFTDYQFHNAGAPQLGAHLPARDDGRADGIDRLKSFAFTRASDYSDSKDGTHLSGLEKSAADLGRFRTPSLRCVGLTAPYTHDGCYGALFDVVRHYNAGGATGAYSGQKDVELQPLGLDDSELSDLVEFLESLTGAPLPDELINPPT